MSYTSENIRVLEGLAPVRQVPAMYIGSTNTDGLHHCLQEVVDNSLDEHLAGHCDKILVELSDNYAKIADNGRGIPVDIHPTTGVSTVETVLTRLHAGGKFFGNGKTGYKVSSGLHGVGVSVVNALSSSLEVVVRREEGIFKQEFECGTPLYPLKQIDTKSNRTGTQITFTPDNTIFETTEFQYDTVKGRLKEIAYLNSKLTFILVDQRIGTKEEIHFDNGIKQLVEDSLTTEEKLHEVCEFYIQSQMYDCKVALVWTNAIDEVVWSYVNNINTRNGGTHVTAVKTAVTKALMDFNSVTKTIKEDVNILGEDLRTGLRIIITLLHQNPQFEGQTKQKLNNTDVRTSLKDLFYAEIIKYFTDNMDIAKEVLQKAYTLASIRQSANKKKELASVRNRIDSTVLLPGRLTSCSSKDPEKCELFIVEGLSAAGSACKERDNKYQSILALKGKVINAYKVDEKALLKNQELSSLLVALGIGTSFDLTKLRYNKIIILTDADHDGEHIKALLLIYFVTHLRQLIDEGKIYIAQPPLYRIIYKKVPHYLKADSDLQEFRSKLTEKEKESCLITRMKGLGEMNADELYNTTMDYNNRQLLQVTTDGVEDIINSTLEKWSGVDTEKRREHILRTITQDIDDRSVNDIVSVDIEEEQELKLENVEIIGGK